MQQSLLPIFETTNFKSMKRYHRCITAILCCFSIAAHAQTFPYDFSVFNDPYYDLAAPISISNADVWDDPSYLTSVGFDVQLFDEITNVLAVMAPGANVINMNEANPDSVQVLAPYYSDLINANDSVAVSPISYQIEGPPNNQIFKLEWKNVGFANEANASYTFLNTTNFQLWLYQNSSIIEFRYGPNTITPGNSIHYFPTGPIVFLAHNVAFDDSGWDGVWCISGDPISPVITFTESGQLLMLNQALSSEPPSGTVYRFAPTSVHMNEERAADFRLWPTLTSDRVYLSSTPGEVFEIHDATSRLIASQSITSADPAAIDVSSWPGGYYIVRNSKGAINRFVKS